MEHRAVQIRSKKNKNISIVTIPGHFATNHSHVSHYIDMTAIKHSYHMAHEAAEEMAVQYNHSMQIDTIICMDGCEVIGGLLAHELIKTGINSLSESGEIHIITPEFNSSNQLIFRDNVQSMIWEKNILLLIASATTGKTISRCLECIQYYGGRVKGISAIFSAIADQSDIPVNALFTSDDLPDYKTYSFYECPACQEKRKIDAIVNSYGYSKI